MNRPLVAQCAGFVVWKRLNRSRWEVGRVNKLVHGLCWSQAGLGQSEAEWSAMLERWCRRKRGGRSGLETQPAEILLRYWGYEESGEEDLLIPYSEN